MKTIITLISFSLFSGLYAIESNDQLRLIEEAMIESATTPNQKAIVSSYMAKIAKDKTELAQRLRASAKLARGGKLIYQNNEKEELLKRAELLEKEAQVYKAVSMMEEESSLVASN